MIPDTALVATLTEEIARLERSMDGERHSLEMLRRDLAALRTELAAARAGGQAPGPDARAVSGASRNDNPDGDPDGDLFDDVPV